MPQQETIYADGFIIKSPHENAPDYVKGNVSVKVSEFVAFLQKHQEKDWVNLDLKEAKDGKKLYVQLNTWKPEKKSVGMPELPAEEINPADIPF